VSKKGHDNLIPLSERTKEEQREIQRKGGIASGKARRKKANIRKSVQAILEIELEEGVQKETLVEYGIKPTMANLIAFRVAQRAASTGDYKAQESMYKILEEGKSGATAEKIVIVDDIREKDDQDEQ